MSCNWSCPRLTASVDRLQRQSLSCCVDQRSIFAGESLLGGDGLHMREVHSAVCTRSVLGPGCAIGSSNNLPVFNQVKSLGVDRRTQVFSVVMLLVAEALDG